MTMLKLPLLMKCFGLFFICCVSDCGSKRLGRAGIGTRRIKIWMGIDLIPPSTDRLCALCFLYFSNLGSLNSNKYKGGVFPNGIGSWYGTLGQQK